MMILRKAVPRACFLWALLVLMALAACTLSTQVRAPTVNEPVEETATVVNVIDGDTIDVRVNGDVVRVRYIGIDTPERDEACFTVATAANVALVNGREVRLVKDVSETDRFGRLLRYVYVGDTFVNAQLVEHGFAEAVRFPPDTTFAETFEQLEARARDGGLGCHPAGVFR